MSKSHSKFGSGGYGLFGLIPAALLSALERQLGFPTSLQNRLLLVAKPLTNQKPIESH